MKNGMKKVLKLLGLVLMLVSTRLQAQPIEEQEAELKTLFPQKPSQQRTEDIFSWFNEFSHFNQSKEKAKKLMPYVRRFHKEGLASKKTCTTRVWPGLFSVIFLPGRNNTTPLFSMGKMPKPNSRKSHSGWAWPK